jgi:hypothetical protein
MIPPADNIACQGRDRRFCILTVGILGAMYLVLHGGRWVPGSDMQIYLDVARSLARGEGFAFNDGPVMILAPGWPYLLAGLMKITPAFWLLNLVPPVLQVTSAGVFYRVLRRWASPARAMATAILSFLFFWSCNSATLLTSEAPFMAVFALALLMALRVREGRGGWGTVGLLGLLCAACVLFRFTGLTAWLLIGAALLSRVAADRASLASSRARWTALAISFVMTLGTFQALRQWLLPDVLPKTIARARGEAVSAEMLEAPEGTPALLGADLGTLAQRLASSGRWVAALLWQPAEIGVSSPGLALAANTIGWLLIALVAWQAVRQARRGQWVFVAALLFLAALAARWKVPNARYLLPVAPLLLLALWAALDDLWLAGRRGGAWRSLSWARGLVIGSLIACNGAMWAVDAYVSRFSDYYATYYAGHGQGLLAAAAALRDTGATDGQVAVSAEYHNLGRKRTNGFGLRATRVLLDRRIRIVPSDVCTGRPNDKLTQWAMAANARFYLYRPPTSPWRVWHFRLPWWQRMVTRQDDIPENPFFELWKLIAGDGTSSPGWERVDLPTAAAGPTRVPGL